MREELDKALCEKYPEIFRNRYASMNESPMYWGFDCGDGWYDLIDTLCKNIQHHIDWKNKYPQPDDEEVEQVVAAQVKEKFGGLSFYFTGGNETIGGMVTMAQSMSYHICEVCGNSGKLRTRAWMRTLCDEHADETITSS